MGLDLGAITPVWDPAQVHEHALRDAIWRCYETTE